MPSLPGKLDGEALYCFFADEKILTKWKNGLPLKGAA